MAREWREVLRRRTRTSKTKRRYDDGQPTRHFSWDGMVGTSLHYEDAEGAWQDVDVNAEEPDGDGFTAKFTKLSYFGRIDGEGRRRFYPNRNDLSYWIEFKKPYPNMGAPTRQNRWFYWNFAHAVIGVRFDIDSLKFGFRLKDDQAPLSITIPFETQGIIRQGRLLLHDGEVVAALRKPIATGSNLDADGMPVQKECTVTWGSGQVTITLDPTGLEYPIEIDPTIDKQVGASADDGQSLDPDSFYDDLAVERLGTSAAYDTFARFIGLGLPSGATIGDGCYLQLEVTSKCVLGCSFPLAADDQQAPAAPTTRAEHVGIARTTASTTFTFDDTGTRQSAEIKTIIQELVTTYGAIDIIQILLDDGGVGSGFKSPEYHSYDYDDHSQAPLLHIEYSVGDGGATVEAVVATATAAGLLATITAGATVSGELATAAAEALVPTVSGGAGVTVTAVVATATAAGLVAVVTGGTGATVSAVVAEAAAAALLATVTGGATVSAEIATALAEALIPVVTGEGAGVTVYAVVATATAEALVPVVTGEREALVLAVVATATAEALAPQIIIGTVLTGTPIAPSRALVEYVLSNGLLAAAEADLYEVPVFRQGILLLLLLHNIHESNDNTIFLLFQRSGESSLRVAKKTLAPGETALAEADVDEELVLNTGDKIRAYATNADEVTWTVSMKERVRV